MVTGTSLKEFPLTENLSEAQRAAASLELALSRAVNPSTGQMNIKAFSDSLKESHINAAQLAEQMGKFGSAGTNAFSKLTEQVVKAEEPLRQTSKLMDDLFTTVSNSLKWQLSATALYGLMDSISGAYQYAKNLDSTLNDIRIVSGQSSQQMAEFAQYANNAARELATTTNQYASASLIYFQQGLSEQ